MLKIIFIPGNSGCTTNDNWFPNIKKDLELKGMNVVAAEFPDPDLARSSIWLPFLIDELKVDADTILIGHSSGAIAALRLAEKQKILASVLVGAYHTDLGMEKEKLSGYFDKPWNWNAIKHNQKWTVLFASQNDPWIPINEPRFIHTQLNCEYHEFKDQGHFGGDYYKPTFPELTLAVLRNAKNAK